MEFDVIQVKTFNNPASANDWLRQNAKSIEFASSSIAAANKGSSSSRLEFVILITYKDTHNK